jgi:hypothetical protein
MKSSHVLLTLAAVGSAALASGSQAPGETVRPATHVRSEFEFTVDAPRDRVAPLFGADAERAWGGASWNPVFVYPSPARDAFGMVFTVEHGGHKSVWVNTAFDLAKGHVQYVSVIPGALATLIDIDIVPADARTTAVRVVYERTALVPEAEAHVKQLAAEDKEAGEVWRSAIERALTGRG